MILSLAALTKYGFNERRLTEADFYEICHSRNIEVQELDVLASFYISILERETIVIDNKLTGVKREFALFHELSHAFLSAQINGPRVLFMGLCDSKEEHEADAFACIALIPQPNIEDTSFMDGCLSGFARKVFEKRIHLYQTYGL
jgi:Zn-dependent peptidase ImmA (M78 family)